MTTSEPTTDNVIQQVEGRPTLIEAAKVAQEAADAILNRVEPTTGEIVRALRGGGIYGITTALELKVIARLESQERELSGITGELERMTARAEQAEKERDLAVKALSDYEDAIDPTVEQIMREFHGTEQRVQPRDGEGK